MNVRKIIKNHKMNNQKSTSELINEKKSELLKEQNELRKKHLPERYNPNLDKK